MPLLFIALGIGVLIVITKRTVEGYVGGQLVRFTVTDIGGGIRLRDDAASAWARMVAAAADDDVHISATGKLSGFRTAEEQESLRASRGAYEDGGYAARVGFSPHQGGYALDVDGQNPANPNYNPLAYVWLRKNGPLFGWFPKGDTFSTREPWHFEFNPGVFARSVS